MENKDVILCKDMASTAYPTTLDNIAEGCNEYEPGMTEEELIACLSDDYTVITDELDAHLKIASCTRLGNVTYRLAITKAAAALGWEV